MSTTIAGAEPPKKILLSRREAAHVLGLNICTLDLMIKRGFLPTVRLGKRVMIHIEDLEEFAKRGCGRIRQ